MKVPVPVTQQHIDDGIPCSCIDCAVSLAILDAIPEATNAEVWWTAGGRVYACATIWTARGVLTGRLGDDADTFIHALDNRQPVEPFTFTITIPEEATAA